MDININGNPGTGNTFQEVNIGQVQNYNPAATTVINNYYGEKPRPQQTAPQNIDTAERDQRKAGIMEYAGRLLPFVATEWKERYPQLWADVLALPEVDAVVYDRGKQQGTNFNRRLVANIINIMYTRGVITEQNVTHLAKTLENSADHAVRGYLASAPEDQNIRQLINGLIDR